MSRDELFDLCMYIAASAEGLKEEPKDYGPLRLLEVLSRLAELAATEYKDRFLEEIAREVKEKQSLLMTDREVFYHFLRRLGVKFEKEAKRRMNVKKEEMHGKHC
jgi:hypothetical protein